MDMVRLALNFMQLRDAHTARHCVRVAQIAALLAESLGIYGPELDEIKIGGLLHDLGKIFISDDILLKPGKLTEREFAAIKSHCIKGYEAIKEFVNERIALMVLQHHEKIDGSGYPMGLQKDQIMLEARIMAVADVYDALRNDRPYRRGFSSQKALDIILDGSGSLFDEEVVGKLLESVEIIEQKIFGQELNKVVSHFNRELAPDTGEV